MDELIDFAVRSVRTRSYSGSEEEMARLLEAEMKNCGFDAVTIDSAGNVLGRVGSGRTVIHFDSHLDTVEVADGEQWERGPFSGDIADGFLWGRGSVDMKSGLCASVHAAARAKRQGLLDGKTVYISGSVSEEYCDGVNLRILYEETGMKPGCCVICEPSSNRMALGHRGKAQVRIRTKGVSSHASAPEKGVNAVYRMAPVIARVEGLGAALAAKESGGTVALSDISCVSVSLNAVPSECSVYLDRRLAFGESLAQVTQEMDALVEGCDGASWEAGTLRRRSWTGKELVYEPMHDPWKISSSHPLAQALRAAYIEETGEPPEEMTWDFSTNAVTPVSTGIPVIGLGPGDCKLAHMRNERCAVSEIEQACRIYTRLIGKLI